jgi:hypothetical protein
MFQEIAFMTMTIEYPWLQAYLAVMPSRQEREATLADEVNNAGRRDHRRCGAWVDAHPMPRQLGTHRQAA